MISALTVLVLAAVQAGQPALPQPAKEKLVCKRETPIGSLIPSRKICLTKTQWAQRIQDGNEEARKTAYDNMGRPSCNDTGSC